MSRNVIKTYILTCMPNNDSNQLELSVQSLRFLHGKTVHEETLHPWLSKGWGCEG